MIALAVRDAKGIIAQIFGCSGGASCRLNVASDA